MFHTKSLKYKCDLLKIKLPWNFNVKVEVESQSMPSASSLGR